MARCKQIWLNCYVRDMEWSPSFAQCRAQLTDAFLGDRLKFSLHHEKTTELLSACRCIFISIQAMHMLGYSSARGALRCSASLPALLLLVYLPCWTLPGKRERQSNLPRETFGKPQCHRVSTTGLPDLDPSASGHLWTREKGHGFHF